MKGRRYYIRVVARNEVGWGRHGVLGHPTDQEVAAEDSERRRHAAEEESVGSRYASAPQMSSLSEEHPAEQDRRVAMRKGGRRRRGEGSGEGHDSCVEVWG